MNNPRITDWRQRRVWLIGASSGIGAALAHALDKSGARLALSARNGEALAALGIADAIIAPCNVNDIASLILACSQVRAGFGGIDIVIYLAGDYAPMRSDAIDLAAAERMLAVNYGGALKTASLLAAQLPVGGGLAFVASVAGYHGLPNAVAYAPGKAALISLAECMHLELAPRGVGVWLINPGFVATRLTAQNNFPMPALISADEAAAAIIAGFADGRFEIHFPRRFSWLMKLLAALPYTLSFPLIHHRTGG